MKRSKTKLMMAAKLKRKAPEAKKSLGSVDGASAKRSFSKPTRMKRAEGGTTISEDSKREIARLRESAGKRMSADTTMKDMKDGAVGMIGGQIINAASRGKIGKGIGNSLSAISGLGTAAKMGGDMIQANSERKEADRIEKGMAEPGREDGPKLRAFGGRVKMRGGKVCK